ncbi:DUF998 domain-containing protein [Streptomyces sp. SID14478]|nr:DUF998 domain-containing protein [Streptomyces sp. SID14478]NEB75446.1 DUF998 domain-containing protein [Streptomyces sp. SID14478]
MVAVVAALGAPFDTDPQLSQLSLTVSDFAALDRGGPIEAGMACLGVASFALLAVARRGVAALRGTVAVLMVAWGAGLVAAAVIPTDPLTVHLSASAYVHRYASIVAFLAMPLAGLVLARRLRTAGAGTEARRTVQWLRRLSIAAIAGAAVMALSAGPGNRELIGLVERLLLGCDVALLALIGHYVQSQLPTRNNARSHRRELRSKHEPLPETAALTA